MTRCVALLRGIGPGNPNMRNEHLRRVCVELGLGDVATVISSGNVVFETDTTDLSGLEETLETEWRERLGFDSTTIIRTRDDLEELIELQPFGTREHGKKSYLLVTFAKDRMAVDLELPFRSEGSGYELLAVTDRELFTVTDTTRERTPDVMSWIESLVGKAITSRTWLTIERILKKMG
ncbi:MAG TPA: DUF1697 domain-containing protein [Acidimicrobiia bacterium]|nr:DUF1697 domain-containing protein [Acidimicrobiia bacterium]